MTAMKTMLEIQTPLLLDVEEFVDSLTRLDNNFAAVVLEENGGYSAVAAAESLKKRCEKDIFVKIGCRDRNRIALHSQLFTAAASEIANVVIVDGPYPTQTSFPAAKPVYDLDSLSLLRMLKKGSPSFDEESDSLLASLEWTIGVCVGGSTSADVARAEKFLAAGADLFFLSSAESVSRFRGMTDKPLILSIREEQAEDMTKVLRDAESAGADGVNLIVKTPDRILDGRIIAE